MKISVDRYTKEDLKDDVVDYLKEVPGSLTKLAIMLLTAAIIAALLWGVLPSSFWEIH